MTDTLTRRAQAPAAVRTWNEEARTVECVWSVGADVRRRDWRNGGDYIERLSMAPGAIDLGRLNGGASLLDSHSAYSMHDRVGIVVPGSARVENGKGIATLQLLRTDLGEALAEACRSGAGFLISVGYRITEATRTEGDEDSLPVILATKWEPLELSAVAIGADPAARTRGMEMDYETEAQAAVEGRETTATRAAPPARQSAPGAEQTRVSAIRNLGTRSAIPVDVIATAIDSGTSIENFRKIVLDALIERSNVAEGTGLSPSYESEARRGGSVAELAGEALYARAHPRHKLSDGARAFAHQSMLQLAAGAVERMGERVAGMSPGEVLKRAMHTTSDFPLILGNAANMSLRSGYEVEESNLKELANGTSHQDFRERFKVDVGPAPKLLRVNEHGEFKRGSIRESREGYGLATFGRVIAMTRQLIVNDDVGALVRLPGKFGQQARAFEIAALAELIEANPTMSDGHAVFSAEHRNLRPPLPLSPEGLSDARLTLRRQVDMGGELIGLQPAYLLVPPELETVAERLLAAVAASETANVNPFAGRLKLVVETRLTDPSAWYVIADPATADALEFAHLAGEEGPQFDTRTGFDVDGLELRIRLDFGAGWLDSRAWVKNPGVPNA